MSLNCAEIEAVIRELPPPGIVRAFFQKDRHALEIQCLTPSGNRTLLIDTTDRWNRICLVPENIAPSGERQRFAQFLQSLLTSYKISRIYQHEMSRIVVIALESGTQNYQLILRLWGTAANILLVDQSGLIVETLKRYPKRDEWPGDPWVFPEKKTGKEFQIRPELDPRQINQSVYFFYEEQHQREIFLQKKAVLTQTIEKQIEILNTKADNLRYNLDEKHLNRVLYEAQLLNSQLFRFQKGSTKAQVEDWETGEILELPISRVLSPSENAQKYFEKYHKLKDSQTILTRQLEETLQKRDEFENISRILETLKTVDEISELDTQLKSGKLSRYLKKNQASSEKSKYGRTFLLSDQYIAYVSRHSREADEILKRVAKGNDYWFHIRDYAGSHVVVKEIRNRELSPKAKMEAALLALYFSKGRNSDEGDIYFTRVKYLHKPNTGEPGLVFPTQEKNIKVRMDKELLEKLLENS